VAKSRLQQSLTKSLGSGGVFMATFACAHCGKTLSDAEVPPAGQYPKRGLNCKHCHNWVCEDMGSCRPDPNHPNDWEW
jgi:DNA-directed RNA polymerase subunit RPC12/RpoP